MGDFGGGGAAGAADRARGGPIRRRSKPRQICSRGAERPLLIAGAGAAYGNAGAGALQTLVERFDMPIAGNGLGRGVVPEDWERSGSAGR